MLPQHLDLDRILTNLNIASLNDMQEAVLDPQWAGKDMLLLSATGSGKTLAFLLLVLRELEAVEKETRALIIAPSRELALQIEQVARQMGTGHKISCCYGGHKREIEENNLIQAPAIIVGTPGRIADHIRRGNIKTEAIETLVLDEFDKSLELGFEEVMEELIAAMPAVKQRILTSATRAIEIPDFAGVRAPVELNFLGEDDGSEKLLDIKMVTAETDKASTLTDILCQIGNRATIIFCNHKEIVESLSYQLKEKGIFNVYYHGSMEQRDRDSALCKFRNGSVNFMVTTDLAARGLDIPNIRYIIHYQLPHTPDIYTHRNGRTARMDASGTVILLLGPHDRLPDYVTDTPDPFFLQPPFTPPEKPAWTTLYIPLGKKNKVNKIDIVGFLTQKGELKKEDIGLIDVKDFSAFVAVRRLRVNHLLHLIKDERLKNKKVLIEVAR